MYRFNAQKKWKNHWFSIFLFVYLLRRSCSSFIGSEAHGYSLSLILLDKKGYRPANQDAAPAGVVNFHRHVEATNENFSVPVVLGLFFLLFLPFLEAPRFSIPGSFDVIYFTTASTSNTRIWSLIQVLTMALAQVIYRELVFWYVPFVIQYISSNKKVVTWPCVCTEL